MSPLQSEMKLIVAGGRDFKDRTLLRKLLDIIWDRTVAEGKGLTIISGMCRGADLLAWEWGTGAAGVEVLEYPANWEKYGKSAGMIRNKQMAKVATHLLAFWDGKSRGTSHMIDEAMRRRVLHQTIMYGRERVL